MKKKKEIRFVCKKCAWENKPLKEQSNENWAVVNPKCDKCGGELTTDF